MNGRPIKVIDRCTQGRERDYGDRTATRYRRDSTGSRGAMA